MIHAGKLLTKLAAARSVNRSFARSYGKSTPPRVRIAFGEKVVHGLVMTVGWVAIPAYISVNLKNYRGPTE